MSHASLLVALDHTSIDDNIESKIAYQMEPFDENGEWFGDGSRWDWYIIGGRYSGLLNDDDMICKGELNLGEIKQHRIQKLTAHYQSYTIQERKKPHFELMSGIKSDETLEEYLARRHEDFPVHYAFLRNRVWQEQERLGWFATPVATECEINSNKETNICVFENPKAKSKIVSWNGSNSWNKIFYKRFVEPLADDTLLVTVDYHV